MSLTPPEEEIIAQWLRSAHSDLAISQIEPPEGVMYEQLCFHAQQAAEKALKALLMDRDEEPPYTHDIHALMQLLRAKMEVPTDLAAAEDLTSYAVFSRYPPFSTPVTEDKWHEMATIARKVVEWVEQQLQQ